MGPFSDYGHYRKQLLTGCVILWIPVFSLLFFISDPDLYLIGIALTGIGTVAFGFGLRSPFASYLPLLINASHELVELKHRLQNSERDNRNQQSIAIEMTQQLDRTPVTEGTALVTSNAPPDLLPPSTSIDSAQDTYAGETAWKDTDFGSPVSHRTAASDASVTAADFLVGNHHVPSDSDEVLKLREEYQNRYEAVAGKTAIGESASFIGGQFVCLMIQFGLLVVLADDDDPKDTVGERSAILVATIWGSVLCYLGINRLKNREGPPFPPGQAATDSWA